jgi:hypothetical protein
VYLSAKSVTTNSNALSSQDAYAVVPVTTGTSGRRKRVTYNDCDLVGGSILGNDLTSVQVIMLALLKSSHVKSVTIKTIYFAYISSSGRKRRDLKKRDTSCPSSTSVGAVITYRIGFVSGCLLSCQNTAGLECKSRLQSGIVAAFVLAGVSIWKNGAVLFTASLRGFGTPFISDILPGLSALSVINFLVGLITLTSTATNTTVSNTTVASSTVMAG